MTLDERIKLLEGCKWVDEIVVIEEYAVRLEFMDKHNIAFVTHGDDMPVIPDGQGMYDAAIAAGRFRMIRRTEGTFTTKLIERLLTKLDDPAEVPEGSSTDIEKMASFMWQRANLIKAVPAPMLTVERLVAFKRSDPLVALNQSMEKIQEVLEHMTFVA